LEGREVEVGQCSTPEKYDLCQRTVLLRRITVREVGDKRRDKVGEFEQRGL
jgi:hypothetical protein